MIKIINEQTSKETNEGRTKQAIRSGNYSRKVRLKALVLTVVENQTELLNVTYVKEEAEW